MDVFQLTVAVFASFMLVSCSNSSEQLAKAEETLKTAESMLESWIYYKSRLNYLYPENSERDESNYHYSSSEGEEYENLPYLTKEEEITQCNYVIARYQIELQEAKANYELLLKQENEKNEQQK